ncbi:hypothetical protein AAFX60_017125 [Aliivibrio fischeri]
MYEESFEIRLDYKPCVGKPERVFLAMAAYVSAFESLTYTVGKAVDADLNFTYELSAVETGSLKSVIKCGSKIKLIAEAIGSIPRLIANSMVGLDEFDSEESIDKSVCKIEDDLMTQDKVEFPNQINIDRYQYAKDIKKLCQASELLVDGETIDIQTPASSNVVYLNTKVRFDKDVDDLFVEHSTTVKRTETLLVKKPEFLGDSQWDFKSVERNTVFSASIEHKEWLSRYQKCELGHLDPGDALIAFISYDACKLKNAKSFTNRNYKVLHVEKVIKGKEVQFLIQEAQKDREKY